uniref:Uncharacterized protein n=1 Tax=Salix viminalis TaxID=40686 RepID=A0A6N2N3H2_SALVM
MHALVTSPFTFFIQWRAFFSRLQPLTTPPLPHLSLSLIRYRFTHKKANLQATYLASIRDSFCCIFSLQISAEIKGQPRFEAPEYRWK